MTRSNLLNQHAETAYLSQNSIAPPCLFLCLLSPGSRFNLASENKTARHWDSYSLFAHAFYEASCHNLTMDWNSHRDQTYCFLRRWVRVRFREYHVAGCATDRWGIVSQPNNCLQGAVPLSDGVCSMSSVQRMSLLYNYKLAIFCISRWDFCKLHLWKKFVVLIFWDQSRFRSLSFKSYINFY